MQTLDVFRLRLRSLFARDRMERELEEEFRLHLELEAQQNAAVGMDPDEARFAALRTFGNVTAEKEKCREARGIRMIDEFREDVRYAARGLRRDRFLAATVTATLAVIIGASTAVFSIANSILIHPLPYPDSDRIDWISELSGPARQDIAAAPDYYSMREKNRIFEEMAAFNSFSRTWTGVDNPERLDTAAVSSSFFRVIGMQPLMGRYIAPEEEGSKEPYVAVLSYEFWRTRLGSDPLALGKKIALDRTPYTIVGVMPQGFDFPRGTQVWTPTLWSRAGQFPIVPTRAIAVVSILARRKAGVSAQQAEAEMKRLTYLVQNEYPKVLRNRGFRSDLAISATPLARYLTGDVRPAILALMGAVALVLLIACVNIANLLLARAAARHRELAVRLALGSNRGRIVKQMLTESLVLALPGGILGAAFGWLAVHLLDALKPAILVHYPPIAVDWLVLAFTLGVTVATSVLFGMAPAVAAVGIKIQDALKSTGISHSMGPAAARLRKLLVIAELGISLVLLIGAGLLARSFVKLAHTDPGFPTDHLLTFRVNPIQQRDRQQSQFYANLLERLQQIPMARSVSLLTEVPLAGYDIYMNPGRIQVEGRPPLPFGERPLVDNAVVSQDFFRTFGIPLKSGRIFDEHDAPAGNGSPFVEPVVVNEAFARQVFPGEDPIGRRMHYGPDDAPGMGIEWAVAGVVGDFRGATLGAEPRPTVYRCTCAHIPVFQAAFAIRTEGDPKAAIRFVERAVRAEDRDVPVTDVKTMDERRDAALAPARFELILIGTFAGIALLLAIAGIYGVMSYLVTRRTREIGIRMALGARPAHVLRSVLGETGVLAILGVAAGLAGAAGITRYLRSLLYGVTRFDPATFAAAAVVLGVIVVAASVGPAGRAARVDPSGTLREE